MRPNRQRFLNILATFEAFLRRVARVNSDHLTTSTRSLVCQDKQKRTPRSVKNALCQFRACQPLNIQVFDHDCRVRIGVLLRSLEMKVAPLAFDFQMGLCHTTRHFSAATATLLASTQSPLFAAQTSLTGPKEARVFNRVALTVGKKHFQADIQANRTAIGIRRRQIACCLRQFAHNQRVPMPIRPLDQVARPGLSRLKASIGKT